MTYLRYYAAIFLDAVGNIMIPDLNHCAYILAVP
jgi:hypothetical protein